MRRICSSPRARGVGFVAVAAACLALSTASDSQGYDFDGDGKSDLLYLRADGMMLRFVSSPFEPIGIPGSQEIGYVGTGGGAFTLVAVADLDGDRDGDDDLIFQGETHYRLDLIEDFVSVDRSFLPRGDTSFGAAGRRLRRQGRPRPERAQLVSHLADEWARAVAVAGHRGRAETWPPSPGNPLVYKRRNNLPPTAGPPRSYRRLRWAPFLLLLASNPSKIGVPGEEANARQAQRPISEQAGGTQGNGRRGGEDGGDRGTRRRDAVQREQGRRAR